MYFVVVGLQTIVLPLATGVVHLLVAPGDPIAIFGLWWAFWGVGTRLLLAGIVQLVKPDVTSGILGGESSGAVQRTLTRELAQANLAFGLVGMLALVPGWWPVAGLAGGIYLLLAFLGHVRNRDRSAMESFAMWTDLLVGAVVVVAGAWGLFGILPG